MTSARVVARARVRQGWARVRRAFVPVLLASAAAGLAWAIAHHVLGHPYPFFAPVSAWVALGFTADRQLRRVAELAIGVAVGVLLGDLLVHVIGSGAVQIAVVLAVAGLVARFIDRGALLATQAGVQAIVIVGLPAAQSGGPVDRWVDALVGGGVALVAAALWPQDPRRRIRSLAEEGIHEITEVVSLLGRGLTRGDEEDVEEALVRGRASQPVLDQWRSEAANARQNARVSPANRRHRGELGDLETAAVRADRAMRNARVLARRCAMLVRDGHEVDRLAELALELSTACHELSDARGAGAVPTQARERLAAVARASDPWEVSRDDWQVQGVVLLLRSLVVDLLEVAGTEPGVARGLLPDI
ncbi:FUSC family protein [Actinotalea sp. BY-33]|uniref:FUSC family protein n=1 Tax=Actinotalea soli TaxID=2819234 RepID=A0A939LWC0_9CELL|nr:FUSC family protein [Actinotalea soli]MBO1753364.1 FUSC family protein [Actinotalea soli]